MLDDEKIKFSEEDIVNCHICADGMGILGLLVYSNYKSSLFLASIKVVCRLFELNASSNQVQVSLSLGCDPPAKRRRDLAVVAQKLNSS